MSAPFLNMSDLAKVIFVPDIGPEKDRVFDPATSVKYDTNIGLPYELMYSSRQLDMTFLAYGNNYNPTKSELKTARNMMRRAGVPAFNLEEPGYPLLDTIVVELACTVENGFVCAVRYFGYWSQYNRWEDDNKTLRGLIKCVKRGCLQIQKLVQTEKKWIKTVIFQTDSDDIMQAVTKIWDWDQYGFPQVMPTGVGDFDYRMLNHSIEALEAANGGTKVLFWKVPSEYLNGGCNQVEAVQSDVHEREMQLPAASCGPCTVRQQIQEIMFAKTGNPCQPNPDLVKRYAHLKKSDSFPLMNNAGIDAKVVMEVDGSVAADALAKINKRALQAKDTNTSKAKTGKDCGH